MGFGSRVRPILFGAANRDEVGVRGAAGELHRSLRLAQGRLFVGSRPLCVRLRFLRMTRGDRGDGRERSSSAAKGPGLKPAWIVGLYAALKRRSSTSLQAGCIGPFGKLRAGSSSGVARFA